MKPIVCFLMLLISSNLALASSWKDHLPIRSMIVPQSGMYPSLGQGGRFFIKSGFLYSAADIKRGDIVTFYSQKDGRSYIYVWRVAAIPGDKIVTVGNDVILNGKSLKRVRDREVKNENIYYEYNGDAKYRISLDGDASIHKRIEVTIKPGFVFVLGDNRNNALDSRYMGLIAIDSIFGIKIP